MFLVLDVGLDMFLVLDIDSFKKNNLNIKYPLSGECP